MSATATTVYGPIDLQLELLAWSSAWALSMSTNLMKLTNTTSCPPRHPSQPDSGSRPAWLSATPPGPLAICRRVAKRAVKRTRPQAPRHPAAPTDSSRDGDRSLTARKGAADLLHRVPDGRGTRGFVSGRFPWRARRSVAAARSWILKRSWVGMAAADVAGRSYAAAPSVSSPHCAVDAADNVPCCMASRTNPGTGHHRVKPRSSQTAAAAW
jgi:hypothetical protein